VTAPLYNVRCGMCGDVVAERVTSATRRTKRHKALEAAHATACHARQRETAIAEARERMATWPRERKVSWLCALDPNGRYRDERDPPTDEELDAAIAETLREHY
jgi:sRNA-binding protein